MGERYIRYASPTCERVLIMKSTIKNIVSCIICLLIFGGLLYLSIVELWYKMKIFFHVHLPLILILLTVGGICSGLGTILEKISQKKSKRG